jgi:hypothetical protein
MIQTEPEAIWNFKNEGSAIIAAAFSLLRFLLSEASRPVDPRG